MTDEEKLEVATEAALRHLRGITYLRCEHGFLHVLTQKTQARLARGMARSVIESLEEA